MVEYRKKRSRSEWLPSAVTKTFQNIFCVDNQTVGNDFHSMGGGGGGGGTIEVNGYQKLSFCVNYRFM